jgi:hypothetical protein
MINMKPQLLLLYTDKVNEDNNCGSAAKPDVKISRTNNYNNQQESFRPPKYNYVKVLVTDPFNNRDIILRVAKKQKGVYL